MATTQKVQAPDGREWEVRSYRFRWPGFFPGTSSSSSGGTSAGAFLGRLVFALVFGLVIWLIAVLLKALVHPFRRAAWVDATSLKPDQKVLHWKTRRGREDAVAAEVAEQLRAGSPPQPQNAEER
jgi:hypothetical protein